MFRKLTGKLSNILTLKFSLEVPPENYVTFWQYVILFFFVFFCCYYSLAAYAILDMNEGLYAEVAREMLVNKHYLIPHLNGVPYLEKPPLLYWLLAMSYHFFGVNAFAARIVPSTITALMCLMWFFFGKKLNMPRTGWITAIILLTSLALMVIGRIVFFDMLLTLCVCGTLLSFYLWYLKENHLYLYLSYLFLALAILTKGLLSLVLLPLVILIFIWLVKADKQRYLALFNKKAILIFLIVVLPWHLLAMVLEPRFTWEYFINNQILRFFNHRIPHDYHTGPIYYYVPRAIIYLLPWSLLLPGIIPLRWKFKRPFASLQTFLWTWFLVMFIFFTASGDKGDYYLVIGITPLAFLLGEKINAWFNDNNSRWLNLSFFVIIAIEVVAGIFTLLFYRGNTNAMFTQNQHTLPAVLNGSLFFLVLFLLVYGGAGIYFCYRHKNKPYIPFLFLAFLIVPGLCFYLTVKEKTQNNYSQILLAQYIGHQYELRPVYLYQDFEDFSSIVFYNAERSAIIDSTSKDLYFGATTDEAKGWFITLPDFLAIAAKQPVYVVIKANKSSAFERLAGKEKFCAVQKNGNVLLLSNASADCKAVITSDQQKELPPIDEILKKK